MRSRRFPISPNRELAISLLHDIAQQSPTVQPRKVDKALALYGAGAFGKLARQYCDHLGIGISFVVDADIDSHRSDPFWSGVRLFALNEVSASDKASVLLAICVGKSPYTQVVSPLIAAGWPDIVPFYTITAAYMDRHPLGNGWFSGELSAEDVDGIAQVLLRYDDDCSRAHHIQFLAWHRLQEEWFFDDAPVETDNRYFIPDIVNSLHANEVFVDLGAHHGSVSTSFLKLVDQRFNELCAIEPDADNLLRLRRCLGAYSPDVNQRIRILPHAVGRENKIQMFFEGLDFASQICAYGNVTVNVRTIDSLAIKPTFIKAHLEGAEMVAILAGTETIREHRPLIALSVYHNRLGLWECSKALMDTFGDCGYRFVFRLHAWHGSGAILYLLNR